MMLDILEDYLDLRGLRYGRLDGSMAFSERQRQVRERMYPQKIQLGNGLRVCGKGPIIWSVWCGFVIVARCFEWYGKGGE